MKFYHTLGKEPKYMVQVYTEIWDDQYYFVEYRKAMDKFKELKGCAWGEGTSISLYDMRKDIRKEYEKI